MTDDSELALGAKGRARIAGALVGLAVLGAALALGAPACGTGGEASKGGMFGLPHAGLGPFRRLDTSELWHGRLAMAGGSLVESGMVLRGAGPAPGRFYAAAELAPAPPPSDAGTDLDAGMPADAGPPEPDLAQFLPRRILRSDPGDGPKFAGGEVVLEASEAWEGDSVYDPWAVVLASGRVRLYYAASGGIGIAEADSAIGAFTRVGTGPVLPGLRRPTIAPRLDGSAGVWLYAEDSGSIVVASSADGLVFDAPSAVDLGFASGDGGPAQLSVGSPAAGLHRPEAAPPRIVLFFESRRADGTRTLGMAASPTGLAFERATLPAFGGDVREGFPAPDFVDAHTTMLYFTVANRLRGVASRGLTVAVSPGTLRFD